MDECAQPAPVSAYGQTKLLGEQYVQRFCRRHFIVRTAWLYSYYGKNFVKTMVNLAKTHSEITVVNDQLGNPTNAVDLAHHLLKLAVSHDYGIYTAPATAFAAGMSLPPRSSAWSGLPCKVQPLHQRRVCGPAPGQRQPPRLERTGKPCAALQRGRRDARLEGRDL